MTGDPKTRRYWRTPLDNKQVQRSRGEIRILAERCKGCSYCVEYCPLGVLRLSSRFNLKGYHPPEVAEAGTCVGCRLCEVLCPEFAIFILEETGEGSAFAVPGSAGEEVLA